MNASTMTPDEVAELTGLSRSAVYRGLATGEIPGIRVGRRWVLLRPTIERWLATAHEQDARHLRAVS